MHYGTTALELVNRILALIPAHPEILTIDHPAELLKVPGFTCDDLTVTRFQLTWALEHARELHHAMATPPRV